MYSIYKYITIISKGDDNIETDVFLNITNSIIINNDVELLTDTAAISIPYTDNISLTSNSLSYKSASGSSDLTIKVGDEISIYLDYVTDSNKKRLLDESTTKVNTVFKGYIKEFDTQNELIFINCEDSMWLFKQKKINISFPANTKSIDFFTKVIKDAGLENEFPINDQAITKADLGKIRSDRYITAAKMFQVLKDKYKYYTYFQPDSNNNQQLAFGLKYQLSESDIVQFAYPYIQGKRAIINNNLDYEDFDKVNELIVFGTTVDNITGKNKTIATIDGEDVTSDTKIIAIEKENREFRQDINIANIGEIALSDLIKDSWNNHETSGFKGNFTTFGMPLIRQGNTIELSIDDGFGDYITEEYRVDNVVTKVTPNQGFTQEIKIGSRIK